jgi:hypothetical protein
VKLNLLGRVRNTRLSHANALLPLFEAVINSIHAIEEQGPERIKSFVQGKAPQYRPLLKHKKAALDTIEPDLSEKLDLELYKINLTYDSELRDKSATILSNLETGKVESPTFEEQCKQFTSEWNELGMSKLATHVAHRKATLSMLEASRKLTTAGKYQLESTIHNLIFPLRKTSDDVPASQMNLWVLDEKLAYHYYLASDVPFKQLKDDVMQIESGDRADLLIFNGPAAFVNEGPPFSSVILVEFKRPARDDYDDDENPITQVATTTDVYMQEIPESVQKTVDAISAELRLLPNLEGVTHGTSDLLPNATKLKSGVSAST